PPEHIHIWTVRLCSVQQTHNVLLRGRASKRDKVAYVRIARGDLVHPIHPTGISVSLDLYLNAAQGYPELSGPHHIGHRQTAPQCRPSKCAGRRARLIATTLCGEISRQPPGTVFDLTGQTVVHTHLGDVGLLTDRRS